MSAPPFDLPRLPPNHNHAIGALQRLAFCPWGPKKQKKRPIVDLQCLSWSSVASYCVELRTHKAYARQLQIPRPIIVCGTGCAKPVDSTLMMIFNDFYLCCVIHSIFLHFTNKLPSEHFKIASSLQASNQSLPELSLFTSTDVASQWQLENSECTSKRGWKCIGTCDVFIFLAADVWHNM